MKENSIEFIIGARLARRTPFQRQGPAAEKAQLPQRVLIIISLAKIVFVERSQIAITTWVQGSASKVSNRGDRHKQVQPCVVTSKHANRPSLVTNLSLNILIA